MAEFSIPDTMPNGSLLSPVMPDVNGDASPPPNSPSSEAVSHKQKDRSKSPSVRLSSPASEAAKHSTFGGGDSDLDAEGSNDEGYGNQASSFDDASPNLFNSHNPPSPSSESSGSVSHMALASRKRKPVVDEHDYINDNAELFNLRRSVSF
jgi:hypothetical protein